MSPSPFFSVCIETYNRESTIEEVIQNILKQDCKDFELIIVDNGSSDSTLKIIMRLFLLKNLNLGDSVTFFFENQIWVTISSQNQKSTEIEGWNAPLNFARGEFIAICEGDDYFLRQHLFVAKENIQNYENVGIYESTTADIKSGKLEIFSAENMMEELLKFNWCPVPSSIIFRRINKLGFPYLFDPTNIYAGEYELYFSILQDQWSVLVNNSGRYVTRGIKFYLKNSFHMKDMINFQIKYKSLYSHKVSIIATRKIRNTAYIYFLINLFRLKFKFPLLRIVIINSKKLFLLDFIIIFYQTMITQTRYLLYTIKNNYN